MVRSWINDIPDIYPKSHSYMSPLLDSLHDISQAVKNSNPFIEQITSSGFGAFFGAGLAFLFTFLHERRKNRSLQSNDVFTTITVLTYNMEKLVNFKIQFLTKFYQELDQIKNHVCIYSPQMKEQELLELQTKWKNEFYPILEECLKIDPELNGLFKRKWQSLGLDTIEIEKLYFIVPHSPHIIRFLSYSLAGIREIEGTFNDRQKIWEEAVQLKEGFSFFPAPSSMRYLYELIDIRQNFLFHVDNTLTLMHATNICLDKFREERYFTQKWKFWSKKFKSYTILPSAKKYVPEMTENGVNGYDKEWFGPYFELIKNNW